MKKILGLGILLFSMNLYANSFDLITLGSDGGVLDGNISGYLIKSANTDNFVSLDAGTILPGITKALKKGSFNEIKIPKDTEWSDTGYIFREKIKGYLLTHSHLDHISGLVISSTEDKKKGIYALDNTISNLKDTVFNWKLWPNFGNEGEGFKLNQYSYNRVSDAEFVEIPDTNLRVKAFPLSHSNHISTMFLVENNGNYMAYYGDVGPDKIEKTDLLEKTFKVLGPLIKENRLKGIMIEVSYDNSREDNLLFGHLTPNWLNKELEVLEKYSGKNKLENLNIIVTHIKPSLKKNDNIREKIKKELIKNNKFKINYYFPQQGDLIKLN